MKKWDVFISHATEDKADVALPLAEILRGKGLQVWVDKSEIKVGDSLRRKIDEGLAESRFGIVILSSAFFGKRWTNRELDGLTAIEDDGHKVILPVWHKVGKLEVTQHSPMLAGIFSLRTADGLEEVADKLAQVILEPGSGSPSAETPSLARRLANLIESKAGREQVFDFLHRHNSVVKLASLRVPYPDVLGLRAIDRPDMGFACWRDDELDEGITLVIPGPTYNPLFDDKQLPLPGMQGCIDSIIGLATVIGAGLAKTKDGRILKANKILSRVYAGRRAFMNTGDMLAREELNGLDVKLRTYDQLIEMVGILFP